MQLELLREAPDASADSAAKWQRQLDADTKGCVFVGLNPKLLAKMADAMGSGEAVVLAIRPPKVAGEGVVTPVAVRPIFGADHDEVRGVIMPLRT